MLSQWLLSAYQINERRCKNYTFVKKKKYSNSKKGHLQAKNKGSRNLYHPICQPFKPICMISQTLRHLK